MTMALAPGAIATIMGTRLPVASCSRSSNSTLLHSSGLPVRVLLTDRLSGKHVWYGMDGMGAVMRREGGSGTSVSGWGARAVFAAHKLFWHP
jgi:hypothetical protein